MATHKKMPREERAKQFMPFAALAGYSRALHEKEEEVRRAYEVDTAKRSDPAHPKFPANSREE